MNTKHALRIALGSTLALGLFAAPISAPADVTPSFITASVAQAASVGPNDVVLVGTLQTKLGAGTDWAPADGATIMKPDGKGNFVFTGKLPKGNYEYKIAIGGSWNENYGEDGAPDGANMKLSLTKESTCTFTFDGITHEVTVEVK